MAIVYECTTKDCDATVFLDSNWTKGLRDFFVRLKPCPKCNTEGSLKSTGRRSSEKPTFNDEDLDIVTTQAGFHFAMRLDNSAVGERSVCTETSPETHGKHDFEKHKESAIKSVSEGREKGQLAAMGGRSAKSIASVAFPDSAGKWEWCHLIADCLGGPTHEGNLVAGSKEANTEMLAIERMLVWSTHLTVSVTAHCEHKDVARFIEYKIRRNDQQKDVGGFRRVIDATDHTAVSEKFFLDLTDEVRQWVEKNTDEKLGT